MEKLGQNNIYSQFLGQYPIVRTYKGTDLINEYVPLYTPPVDWSDIRVDCPANSIALYVGHKADYSSYDNLGFTATCVGGYNVFIDGERYLGKNLLEMSVDNIKLGYYIDNSGVEKTSDSNFYNTRYIPVVSGETYTLSTSTGVNYVNVMEYDGSKTFIKRTLFGSSSSTITNATITLDSNTKYILIGSNPFVNASQTTLENILAINWQFELGSTATSYQPFGVFASGAQCSITWSTSGITTGDDITTPTALKAHKIWIEPATEGNNITVFKCARVATSGKEEQCVLWAHYNLINAITIASSFGQANVYENDLLKAITAKNNLITYVVSSSLSQSGFYSAYAFCSSLEYLPVLKAENTTYYSGTYLSFPNVQAKKVVIKNNNGKEDFLILNGTKVEEFSVENGLTLSSGTSAYNSASGATKLKKFPKINQNKGENFQMSNCPNLEPVNIDDRFNDIRKLFRFYGTSTIPTPALKSLRVSNEAPFDGATPQIKVDYTGLDRNALVQLFNDLPYNVGYTVAGSPTITDGVVSGFSKNDYISIPTLSGTDFSEIEFQTRILNFSGIGSNNVILRASSAYYVVRYGSSGKIEFIYQSDEGSKTLLTNNDVSSIQDLYIKTIMKNNLQELYISTDGNTWQLESSATDSITSLKSLFYSVEVLGAHNAYDNQKLRGSIDLNNTYIKINDVYWFRGNSTRSLASNLTSHGTLTVDNGVVSGFSTSNYYSLAKLTYDNTTTPFHIKVPFTYKTSTTSTNQTVISCRSVVSGTPYVRLRVYTNTGKLHIVLRDFTEDTSDGTSVDTTFTSTTLTNNTSYLSEISYDSAGSVVMNLYNSNGSLLETHSASIQTKISSGQDILFGQYGTAATVWAGSIDFKGVLIDVNGSRYLEGTVPMTKTLSCVGCSGNRLNIVGTPTINNGVVSNFTADNYVQAITSLNLTKDFTIKFRIDVGTTSASSFSDVLVAYGFRIFTLVIFERKIRCGIGNGSSWSNFVNGTQTIQNGTFDIEFKRTNGKFSCRHKLASEDDNWVNDFTNYNPNLVYTSDFNPNFGSYGISAGTEYFTGSLYLDYTSCQTTAEDITFTSDRYLLPADKAIATDKGWSLTLL